MVDLKTDYLGLKLKNPIIIGSCGLTNSLGEIKKIEAHNAAAVVLKSIFEEQISMESSSLRSDHPRHSQEADYINYYTRQHNLDNYLKLISDAKKEVKIPIIASINCASSPANWVSFARTIQDSGADALELNIFILPGNCKQKSDEIEKIYFEIIDGVKQHVSIPLAVKMGFYFSSLANMIFNLSLRGVSGIVLFNRFQAPDIDLAKEEIDFAHIFSSPDEISLPLRWIGMMSKEVKCDLAAATGIHDGHGVIKCLLAGAKAVQVVSAIYKEGTKHIPVMLDQIEKWMEEHKYKSVKDFTGKLAQERIEHPLLYERTQFMKYYASRNP
ncbi:MAG: dihydroorotate dehydrogenase-like protein [Candidatus Aminicenantes bacterium]|nr:dihydroorotate dehydrogenase-like protein [Candidatus Aminicenantes bacterium]